MGRAQRVMGYALEVGEQTDTWYAVHGTATKLHIRCKNADVRTCGMRPQARWELGCACSPVQCPPVHCYRGAGHLVSAGVIRVHAIAADLLGVVEALGHDRARLVAADVLSNRNAIFTPQPCSIFADEMVKRLQVNSWRKRT